MDKNKLYKERSRIIENLNRRLNNERKTPANPLATNIEKVNENLYFPLKEAEIKKLNDADGNELEKKAYKVNSSVCLLLNALTPLRQNKEMEILGLGKFRDYDIEVKLQVLNGSKKKANIDALLTNSDSFVYIESKFMELFYYKKKTSISPSYYDERKYPNIDIYHAAKQFLGKHKYYDVDQLVKHTIGIYRDCLNSPEKYRNKKVYLLNLCWELINSTDNLVESYKLQLNSLQETTEFIGIFNKSMSLRFKRIGVDFKFIYINYYDFVRKLTNISNIDRDLYSYMTTRYFGYKIRTIDVKTAVDYFAAQVTDGYLDDDIYKMVKDYNVIEMHIFRYRPNDKIHLYNQLLPKTNAAIIICSDYNLVPRLAEEYKLDEYVIYVSQILYYKVVIIYLSASSPETKKISFI